MGTKINTNRKRQVIIIYLESRFVESYSFDLTRHRLTYQGFVNRHFIKMASEKKAVDLGLLEEDDEFEEFPAEEWDAKQEDQTDVNVWEDNWDDDAIEDDFSVQLRSELENQGMKMES